MVKEYRKLTAYDAVEYQELVHKAYKDVTKLGIHFAAATADLKNIEIHLKTNLVYGLFIDDKLVCTISLRLPWGNNPGPYGVPHIGWFATDPNRKKQGLANQMLDWLEAEILNKVLNVPFVTLGTAANHPWLSQFYIQRGFEEVGRANLTTDHTTIYYRKILNPELFDLWEIFNPNRTQFTH